ncbi:hypothetical protein NC653_040431 [Populus alba x Populus x berolinensis]|uniref:Uncharacterized protein n=1 Tax=Populus alba x Populus x berolinensis TaxID=444605 RepID=A0AAD6LE88_9ROSI|nr:hypothetical protein NC653_040431 [Populus alba x Populus x berolinensis]
MSSIKERSRIQKSLLKRTERELELEAPTLESIISSPAEGVRDQRGLMATVFHLVANEDSIQLAACKSSFLLGIASPEQLLLEKR